VSAHRAVVFDLDGLMLDTESVALDCWLETAREAGWPLEREDCLVMVGLDQQASERALIERVGAGFPIAQVTARAKQRYLGRLRSDGIRVKPGVGDLLDWLESGAVPFAIATSTRHALAIEKLELAGLRGRFNTIVCADQVGRGKPAPDVYLEAARQLGEVSSGCIALEDSEAGLRAAHAAGMRCIVVPDLRAPSPEYAVLAHAVVATLEQAHRLVETMLAPASRAAG
jgi:HAD superfamily hydrolase (TIGR01509 family)